MSALADVDTAAALGDSVGRASVESNGMIETMKAGGIGLGYAQMPLGEGNLLLCMTEPILESSRR
jgi:acyl CoA:acetate/3-ketoacid CoA transferase alpha subunit